jgi:hypothetical protein
MLRKSVQILGPNTRSHMQMYTGEHDRNKVYLFHFINNGW